MLQRFPLLSPVCLAVWAIQAVCCSVAPAAADATEGKRLNVLMIAIDDLRPELGCYGAEHIHSPNLDRLASQARLFERAYCQQAVCNPSRTSLMTGMRPDTSGVVGNHSHFRDRHPDVVTLPQLFKDHRYHAAAIGKIYHGVFPEGSSSTKWDTMGDPESWSVPAIRFGPRYYHTEAGVAAARQVYQRVYQPRDPGPDDWMNKLVFGPATEAPEVADDVLYDGKVATAAIEQLRNFGETQQPFFLAVGFIKPHSPYIAPRKYFDLYKEVGLAEDSEWPADTPGFVGHSSGEIRRYTDQPAKGEMPEQNRRRIRQAYFACVSYIDAQVGRVLGELDRSGLSENTIVVLFGDHGYHLGEQGLWGKTTNFELDTRVPLIVRVPGMPAAGVPSDSIVELVDLYPTLAEIAGLPISKSLEGESFASVLSNPQAVTRDSALSQYPRGKRMGYSLRTPHRRLTQWLDRSSGEVHATELYEYSTGRVESRNLAANRPDEVKALASRLIARLDVSDGISPLSSGGALDSRTLENFESLRAGPFDQLETPQGVWHSLGGVNRIDDRHGHSGKQCLQMAGGQSVVRLDLDPKVDTRGELRFQAERWTKRSPFVFRIEKDSGEGWQEIYQGDRGVKVGRAFLSDIHVPLGDAGIKRLRLTLTSPPNTGILIDDVRFAAPRPQEVVSARVQPLTLPALKGTQWSPLLKLKIDAIGSLDPIALSQFQGTLLARESDASRFQVFATGSSDVFSTSRLFGGHQDPIGRTDITEAKSGGMIERAISLRGDLALQEGSNYFWVACRIGENASIDGQVGATCDRLHFSNGKTIEIKADPSFQRLGVAVRQAGQDNVHTCRIPGLATSKQGTLIAVYDVRYRGRGDLPGDIDVGMSRSTDGGQSWDPMKVIMDMGNDPAWRYDGIGDPAVLVDRNTGTIWVAATWSHGNRSWVGSGQGLTPEQTGQLMLVRSDDDGITWSAPINITSQVKRPEWCFLLQGPGKGITMQDGTLVFAAQYQDPPQQKRLPHSTILYSKDHGQTWQVGTGAFDDTTEAQVVEVEPGVLMLNCRYNRKSVRVVMTTTDMGKTWQKHPTSERSLIEPRACMASLVDAAAEAGSPNGLMLFSNPDSVEGRKRITIKGSVDRGMTWPKSRRLLLDEGSGAGYSCMTMVDERTVGILYEGSQAQMTFQRVALKDLSSGTLASSASGQLTPHNGLQLPQVFGNHMVLQAGARIPVWGRAAPGRKVSVRLADEQLTTQADQTGRWRVDFPAHPVDRHPSELIVRSAGEELKLIDILFGEVWVCAGQSNMQWPLRLSRGGDDEAATAGGSAVRLLHLEGGALGSSGRYDAEQVKRLTPDSFCEGEWEIASKESSARFSAVGWYFGRTLSERLGVPVGLICPAVGGTPAEAWVPRDAIETDPQLKQMVDGYWLDNPSLAQFCRDRAEHNLITAIQAGLSIPGDDWGPNHSYKPGFMWESAIKPLIPFAIRGVAWYQGESNAETADRVLQHERLFPLLVQQWRKRWGRRDLPFLTVQLPALKREAWPAFRESQRRMLDRIAYLSLAVTIDTGHPSNVHPADKKIVGQRLARVAVDAVQLDSEGARLEDGREGGRGLSKEGESILYQDRRTSGPRFISWAVNGHCIEIQFDDHGDAIKSSDGESLRHFEIAGEEGVFYPAHASIISDQSVSVSSPLVRDPKSVRYAWVPYPEPPVNLTDREGHPASPFSTADSLAEAIRSDTVTLASRRKTRPNILLIVGEDHGCELSCYGDPVIQTPRLDAFASQGVLFENGYVTQSVCSPSRSSIFTGLYPHQNGQLGLATHRYGWFRRWPTSYSLLQGAGYRTGLIGKTHVIPADAVEDHVDFRFQTSSNFSKKGVSDYAVKAGEFFRKSEDPFFMTVNYPDAHWPLQGTVDGLPSDRVNPEKVQVLPFMGDPNPRLLKVMQNYYDCMLRLDECVGQLLDELKESGKAENTLVIFIGDHGAQMARGKVTVYEGGVKVPFLVRWPGVTTEGLRSKALVSTIDLLPTFLDAAGLPAIEGLPGRSVKTSLGKDATYPDRQYSGRQYLACERNCDAARHTFPQRTIRDARYKLIHSPVRDREDPAARYYRNHGASHWSGCLTDDELKSASEVTRIGYARWLNPPEYQLFDLQNDPHEWHDLASGSDHHDVLQRMKTALRRWQEETDDPLTDPTRLEKLMQENDDVFSAGKRWPDAGWQYLEYLAPDVSPVAASNASDR